MSKAQPVVSICVPVYNVEEYLPRCLDSLCGQTFSEIEIIVVNDASPDNSESIILEYVERDSRIRYFKHETNKLLPQARKTAVEASQGEYIAFVDSDDWVYSDFIKKMYETAKKQNADIVSCRIQEECVKTGRTHIREVNKGKFNVQNSNFYNKLFRASLLHHPQVEFPDFHYGEDTFFVSIICYYAKHRVYIPDVLYHYYRFEERWKMTPQLVEHRYVSFEKLYDYFQDRNESYVLRVIRFSFSYLKLGFLEHSLRKNDRHLFKHIHKSAKKIEKKMIGDTSLVLFVRRSLLKSIENNSTLWKIYQKRKFYWFHHRVEIALLHFRYILRPAFIRKGLKLFFDHFVSQK